VWRIGDEFRKFCAAHFGSLRSDGAVFAAACVDRKGAGYEWAAASNWTLRLEYLVYVFDGARAAASTSACPTCSARFQWDDLTIHTVRLGVNYRWGGDVAPQAPPAVVDWSGPYAGVHGGFALVRGRGHSTTTVDAPPTPFFAPATFDLSDNGPLVGGQVGYNWQRAGWVFGIEADLSVLSSHAARSQTSICGTLFGCPPGSPVSGAASLMRQDVNWLAGLRGRIGHVWGPGLVYVTGGGAIAHVDHRADTADGRQLCGLLGCAFPADGTRIRSGWTLGGGAEWPIWSNWTLRGEYLFHRFAGVETTATVTPAALCTACAVTLSLERARSARPARRPELYVVAPYGDVGLSRVSATSIVSCVYGFWITGTLPSSAGIGARSP
jgi:outer membrane immunogenic protein